MSSDSDDSRPLALRAKPPAAQDDPLSDADGPGADVTQPSGHKPTATTTTGGDDSDSASPSASDSDSEDDMPLSARQKQLTPKKRAKPTATKPAGNKRKRDVAAAKKPEQKRQRTGGGKAGGGEKKWSTLEHAGVLFPPEYEPHGVKMLYDGKPVDLTPAQEEVATMYAVMLETDYISKPIFIKNFWEGFKEVLGPRHTIQSLDRCNFRPIYEWHMAQREAKKNTSKEEKARAKEERDAAEAKYKVAYVDGRQEQVGNFRVEPPGLFRGRGEHPRMGKIKQRVYPRDITINIGPGAPVPEHPFKGQTWKEVRHDNTVTWLAFWKDTINPREYKYVWLGAASSFKADSDLAKYEKARKLKDYIDDIRANYTRDWDAKDLARRQMAVALYFLDKLALRAGHEKDEDEADTVGCCTLKVENVELVPPNHIKFDFLGKDSIRYENTVEVEPRVYRNVEQFVRTDRHGKRKAPRDMLFDAFDATDLNKELKNLMDGLSVKVFRTYNASITLDRLLAEHEAAMDPAATVDAKKADYDRANKEVAILCNHQRSVPKTHDNQVSKMQEKVAALQEELDALEGQLKDAKRGKGGNADTLAGKVERKRAALSKAQLAMAVKEDLKTVALGTSKINYMDPRITIAWCKRNEVPIEKVFNKSLLSKFNWAMDVAIGFKF